MLSYPQITWETFQVINVIINSMKRYLSNNNNKWRGITMKKEYLNIFEDYLIEIKISKTNGTFEFYQNHLLHFGKFVHDYDVKSINDIGKDIIVDYLQLLRNTVSNATINKRVGIIKRCLQYYEIKNHYIYTVVKFKEKKNSYEMIPDKELKRIINYVSELPEEVGNNLMYKAIIFILINTGIRLTELYNLEKRNVKLHELEILLTKTKSGVDRVVYFRPVIKDVIKKLIDDKTNHKYLLHNKTKNRPIDYSDIKYLFSKIKKDLNITKLHPHMFRHTYATKLLQNGVDIKTVMDFMGHNNLSTTQRYMHYSKEHAKKSYLDKYNY